MKPNIIKNSLSFDTTYEKWICVFVVCGQCEKSRTDLDGLKNILIMLLAIFQINQSITSIN